MKGQLHNCLILAIIGLGLTICLFGTSNHFFPQDGFSPASHESLTDFEGQFKRAAAIFFILISLLAFDGHQFKHGRSQFEGISDPIAWQWIFLLLVAVTISIQHFATTPGIAPLTLITAIFIAKSMRNFTLITSFKTARWTMWILVSMLALASLYKVDEWEPIKYQFNHEIRWTGPWNSPNTFGLLMGCGILLASSQFIYHLKYMAGNRGIVRVTPNINKLGATAGLVVAVFCGRAMWHSYSRGAWIACLAGTGYLMMHGRILYPVFGATKTSDILSHPNVSFFRRKGFSIFCISIFTAIICFWRFQQYEWQPIHRVFSSVNSVDFSWRNRVTAWEGALQITSEHSWLGSGWGQSEALYKFFYLPSKLTESAAIEMNDYLMLGATLGIPALFCLGMYFWLALTKKTGVRSEKSPTQRKGQELEWLKVTCRAGAIVLLAGFWFDGGLFKLATASTFWILLELGNVCSGENIRDGTDSIKDNDAPVPMLS